MSDSTESFTKHKRLPNIFRESRMTIQKGENIGPYEILEFLKEGSSSKIYLARSKYTNEKVIIKAIKKSHFKNNLDDILLITKQIETLKVLKHRNIVTLYEIYESKKYIYLMTEYLSGKDLIEKIIKKKRFNEEEALRIFFQLLDAFTYMHKMNICHLNLRVEHILFDKNNRPKIVGFGYSSFYEKGKSIEGGYGSLCYVCPEIIDEQPYSPELADVWSLGVILYVLICGYLPFSDEDDNKNKILISTGKIDFPKEISNKLKDLLKHMLDKNPKKRYTFQKIVKHPWLKPYTEKIFSEGINIHKTIYPVDERILNIINEYGFDKNKVKDDLIMNKYNIGTGLFKQIVRKLLDLKMKNISDLWSEEFMAYRDNKKNKIEDGDKKYEDYIKQIDEKYKKREDFVNNFKEREDYVVERLMHLKDKKEEKKKERLNTIEEDIIDFVDEDENANKSFEEKDDEDQIQQNNIRNVKTERKIFFPKAKTPLLNLGELMSNRKKNLSGDIAGNDNIEIIYNKDQDVDIIQQFQEEQNKKVEKSNNKESPKTPNNEKRLETNKDFDQKIHPFKLSITPDKKDNLTKKILDQELDTTSKETKELTYSILSNNFKASLYSNKNSLSSNISNIHNFNNGKNNKNYKKNISGITLKSLTSQNSNASFFRMTSKSNSKAYLDRSSLCDDFLKKNHPDNIRKTILKNSFFSNMNKIDEGNDDSESEKEKEKKEKKENGLKDSGKLKYSLSFGDDDDDEEDGDDSVGSKETDLKLFNILENENDEELQELKKIYFEDKADKSLKKSIIKKKSVRFNEDTSKRKEKSPDSILKKSNLSKRTFVSSISNSVFDRFEERLKRYNKTYKITSDKEETGPLKLDTQLEISLNDDDGKFKANDFIKFNRDKKTIKKLDFLKLEEFGFDIDNIYNKMEKNYIFKISENLPIKKINILHKQKNKNINDNIDKIHKIFTKKNKNKIRQIKDNSLQKEKSTLEKKENKKSLNKGNSKNKPKKENNKRKSKDNNTIIQKKDETIKKNKEEIPRFSKTEKIKQESFIIYPGYTRKNKEEIHHFTKTEKIKQDSFSIYPNIKSNSNSTSNLNDNYLSSNTYNGNLPIDTSKYNNATLNENVYNPNIINYDLLLNKNNDSNNSTIKERSTFYPEKKHKKEKESKDFNLLSNNKSYTCFSFNAKKISNTTKTTKKLQNKNENINNVEPKRLKITRKKNLKQKSPRVSYVPKDIKKYEYSTKDKKLEKNNTNSQMQLFKTHYKKYEEMTNSLFSIEEPNFPKNLDKKRRGFSSEKNINDIEKIKRDGIIEKIQNCHNLLNTLKEQEQFMTLNKSKNNPKIDKLPKTSSFYKKFETINYNERSRSRKKIIDMKKDINRVNKFEINENNNNDNGIKQIYIKNNNEKKFNKNLNYKKINNNYDNKNSYEYLHKDKNFNTVLLPKNFSNNNQSSFNMRTSLRNENNSHNNSSYNNRQINNYSFDNHQKQLSNIKEEEPINPNKRLIGLYKKYEKEKKQSGENGSFNKTYGNNFNKKYENSFKNNKSPKDN